MFLFEGSRDEKYSNSVKFTQKKFPEIFYSYEENDCIVTQ